MTGTVIALHDFIESVRLRVPRDVDRHGRIHEYFGVAHYAADIGDTAEAVRLLDMVWRRVVQELRWQAESWANARCRRQADRIEQSYRGAL